MHRVYIGYDQREAAAYAVAEKTLKKHSPSAVVTPLKSDRLAASGLLRRPQDRRGIIYDIPSNAPCSTEFAISRFLVPHLAQTGWALFVDADVVFMADVAELFDQADESKAVMVVKHADNSEFLDITFDERCEILNRQTGVEEFRVWPVPGIEADWGSLELLLSGKYTKSCVIPAIGEWKVQRSMDSAGCGKIISGGVPMFDVAVMVEGSEEVLFSKLTRLLSRKVHKMDGQEQLHYRRKCWSSVMLFNCDHPANKRLSLQDVNERPGRDLHGFYWLADSEIGSLTPDWNWLVGVQEEPLFPKLAHFTLGGPFLPGWKGAQHDDLWLRAAHG